eukprot:comp23446_c0_seq1/m.39117 comp23446_c0_seq1/g.39117  ORF comp23446_c0_seq1/g.39117 comp23446_c0_seq1/m.39117 type:complete len:444 (-) comp23446_c0_seq1:180-1511(-)
MALHLAPGVCEVLRAAYEDRPGHFDRLLAALATPPSVTSVRCLPTVLPLQQAADTLAEHAQGQRPQVHAVLPDVLVLDNGSAEHRPILPRKVVVDMRCGTAVLRGSHVYAPAVRGATPNVQAGHPVTVLVDVQGRCKMGMKKGLLAIGAVPVGNGIAQMAMDDLFKEGACRQGLAVDMCEAIYQVHPLDAIGRLPGMDLQSIPSAVVAHVLHAQAGEAVLDLCAAPGGKTVHVAGLMANKGLVVAVDRTAAKAQRVQERARRHGLDCVVALQADSTQLVGTQPPMQLQELREHVLGLVGQAPEAVRLPAHSFDRVLADVPCSALGLRPRLRSELGTAQLLGYPDYQKQFMAQAVRLVKEGGVVVYSTCTIHAGENEGMVRWLLDTHRHLRLTPQTPQVGGPGLLGVGLSEEEASLVQRFDPVDSLDCPGFFVAKFAVGPMPPQ